MKTPKILQNTKWSLYAGYCKNTKERVSLESQSNIRRVILEVYGKCVIDHCIDVGAECIDYGHKEGALFKLWQYL